MKRDRNLLIALILFAASALATTVQAVIVNAYVKSAVMGGWEHFERLFSVDVPTSDPNKFCFDFCAPDLPFLAGWIAIGSFTSGLVILAMSWWKSRS